MARSCWTDCSELYWFLVSSARWSRFSAASLLSVLTSSSTSTLRNLQACACRFWANLPQQNKQELVLDAGACESPSKGVLGSWTMKGSGWQLQLLCQINKKASALPRSFLYLSLSLSLFLAIRNCTSHVWIMSINQALLPAQGVACFFWRKCCLTIYFQARHKHPLTS